MLVRQAREAANGVLHRLWAAKNKDGSHTRFAPTALGTPSVVVSSVKLETVSPGQNPLMQGSTEEVHVTVDEDASLSFDPPSPSRRGEAESLGEESQTYAYAHEPKAAHAPAPEDSHVESPPFLPSPREDIPSQTYTAYASEWLGSVSQTPSSSATFPLVQLLKFNGTVSGRPAVFLIDSGASSDFVSEAFVQRHHLQTQPSSSTTQVRLADGSMQKSSLRLCACRLIGLRTV